MIKLYGIPQSSNVAKVRYCLSFLNLDYELIETSPSHGGTRTEEFLAINPTGKIPAIDVDGFKLFESNTINRYLATINHSTIYPVNAKERAMVDAWMDYGSMHIGAAMSRVFFNRVLAPKFKLEVDESSLKTGLEFLDKFLPTVERQLSKKKYFALNEFSLADITLLAVLDPCELSEISLDAYPNIVKWRNQRKAESFYQKCYTDYTEFVKNSSGKKS